MGRLTLVMGFLFLFHYSYVTLRYLFFSVGDFVCGFFILYICFGFLFFLSLQANLSI